MVDPMVSKPKDEDRHKRVPIYISLPLFKELRRYTLDHKLHHYSEAIQKLLDESKEK